MSDLGLHCLPMSPQKDDRHLWVSEILKWVKGQDSVINYLSNYFYQPTSNIRPKEPAAKLTQGQIDKAQNNLCIIMHYYSSNQSHSTVWQPVYYISNVP